MKATERHDHGGLEGGSNVVSPKDCIEYKGNRFSCEEIFP